MSGGLALLRPFSKWKTEHQVNTIFLFHSFFVTIRVARGQGVHGLPRFLAYLVILCFDRQCPEQNTVARLKLKYLAAPKIWAGYATGCNYFKRDGLRLSRTKPCSSASRLPHSTFVVDVQSLTDKKLVSTQGSQTLQNSNEKQYSRMETNCTNKKTES